MLTSRSSLFRTLYADGVCLRSILLPNEFAKPTVGLSASAPVFARTQATLSRASQKLRTSRGVGTVRSRLLDPVQYASWNVVPPHIQRPSYANDGKVKEPTRKTPDIKDDIALKKMRAAGLLAAQTLAFAEKLVKPGVTCEEIDTKVHEFIISHNAYPSPLNYMGFPKSVCTSVNEVLCHGIPDDLPLKSTDLVNVDITVFLDGYHGDTSKTIVLEDCDAEGRRLTEVTKQCLEKAIAICKPGVPFRSIGKIIEAHANENGYSVPTDFTGHGIGTYFHGPPYIFHVRNNFSSKIVGAERMEKGMVFTIEPMICEGEADYVILKDQWTAVTADHGRSAQFEHMIAITLNGCEILTEIDSNRPL